MKRTCLHCRSHFATDKGKAKFCSTECKYAAQRREARPATCPQCGRPFIPSNPRIIYCSRQCSDRAIVTGRHFAKPGPPTKKVADLMQCAPDNPGLLAAWFSKLTDEQLERVWVPLVVEQFGEGHRASLAAALREVRLRFARMRHGTEPVRLVG